MADLPKRIAIVYDRVNKWGGAERTLLALHELFPQAPLYTSVYDSDQAPWAKVFPEVISSFLNRIPFAKNHHELIPFLTPIAFEAFDFSEFEAVITVTSADAKGIVTKPGTYHFCYCLTPTRYLWSHNLDYYRLIPDLLKPISIPWFKYLKKWDLIAAKRPDTYLAISKTVQTRIKKYYHQESEIVYPPVNTEFFSDTVGEKINGLPEKYFLFIGRLVSYKNPELVISAFTKSNIPLVVVGKGSINWGNPLLNFKTRKQSNANIFYMDWVSDDQLVYLLNNCEGFIHFHEEDFGILPVEAMAAGKPVIGINRGGVAETVIDGLTGILSQSDSENSLVSIIKNFSPEKFDSYFIKNYAKKFSRERFNREFVKVFSTQWKKYKNTYMY
jgi:glycosyltransferase involved in cell wall biosynthesis